MICCGVSCFKSGADSDAHCCFWLVPVNIHTLKKKDVGVYIGGGGGGGGVDTIYIKLQTINI